MQSILKMCNIHSFHSYPFNVQVNITQLRTNKENKNVMQFHFCRDYSGITGYIMKHGTGDTSVHVGRGQCQVCVPEVCGGTFDEQR